jgi:hypothetical protein
MESTSPPPHPESTLQVHLAEHSALMKEIRECFESQRQAFNYLIIILAAAIGAIAQLYSSSGTNLTGKDGTGAMQPIVSFILLFLPLVTAPLGFIFFGQ